MDERRWTQSPNHPITQSPSHPITQSPPHLLRPTWLEIDLDALAGNVRHIRRLIGPERLLYAVVKANAYGHGADLIAPAALEAGADRLAVAALNEAIALREDGIRAPILVLGYTPPESAHRLLDYTLTPTVYDREVVQAFAAAARRRGTSLPVQVKVDTGMHRLGLYPEETPAFLRSLSRIRNIHVEGIFTHFSTADEADKSYTRRQFATFTDLLGRLAEVGLRPPIAHAANSAATLSLPDTHLDAVRCGIALYGLDPSAATPTPDGFRPVLSWKAHVAQVKSLQPGDPVSYGNTYVARERRTVAVIPVGYADGLPRAPRHWGHVLVGGHVAPIVGRVCMDQTIVDVSEIVAAGVPVQRGDEVVLIGAQGGQRRRAEDVAARLGTINYEVTSRLMARLPRVVVG